MKLLIPIICAIFAGELLIGYISYKMMSDVITKVGTDDGLRSARSLSDFINSVVSNAHLDLSAIAAAPSFQGLLLEGKYSEDVETYMRKLVERQPLYSGLFALNTQGLVMAFASNASAGPGSLKGRDLSGEAYFKASLKGEYFISPVEVSKRTGRIVSLVSIPVRDWDEDSIIGVVAAAIRVEEINSRHITPVTTLEGYGYAMVVNEDGIIVGHRDENKMWEAIPEELKRHLAAIGEKEAAFEAVIDGTPSMIFAVPSQYTSLLPIVVCPIDDFYALTRYLARLNMILAGSTILLLTVVIWVTVRGITKALSTTISYASAVSHGKLDTPLLVQRRDEVGMLAQSLRDMVGTLKSMIVVAEEKTNEAEAAAEAVISSIVYASKIQRSLLPKESVFQEAFSDYSIMWNPRDIVGGDIYWAKTFDNGTVLCVCDCTGHGTSGALLTMLIASSLETSVEEHHCQDTAEIIWQLEKTLLHVLSVDAGPFGMNGSGGIRDGCDLAVLFIAKDGSVTLSASHTHVFVCDGAEVQVVRGQNIYIGEGRLKSKNDIKIVNIPAKDGNKFYIASDGLFDQPGGAAKNPYGYKEFQQIILKNHGEKQSVISDKIWAAFEKYRGAEPRVDDFELITFKP